MTLVVSHRLKKGYANFRLSFDQMVGAESPKTTLLASEQLGSTKPTGET